MPLDPNIFYNFAALRAQDNARLGQTMNNALQGYQDRKMKEAELRAKGLDIDSLAKNAMFKAYSGQQLSPDDIAIIKTKSAMDGQKVTYQPDAEGNVRAVSQPSLWDTFSQMQGLQSYTPQYPVQQDTTMAGVTFPAPDAVSREPLGPLPGIEGVPPINESDLIAQSPRMPINMPQSLTPQQEAALQARGDMFSGEAPPLPGGDISVPSIPGAGDKTNQALREEAGKAAISLEKQEQSIPLEVRLAREREAARKEAEVGIKSETQKQEAIQKDTEALPLLQEMLAQNNNTLNIPYAEKTQGFARFFAPEASKNLDLMQQNRLNLAAPLAKALGVNPTDKDFKATLDRIVDVNATKESRDAQIRQLMFQIIDKNPEIAGLPKGSKRIGTTDGKQTYEAPDGRQFIWED